VFQFEIDGLDDAGGGGSSIAGLDNAGEAGPLGDRVFGRAAEFSLAAIRGFLAIPAGIERLIIDPILPGEQDLIRQLIQKTEYTQEIILNDLGLDESTINNFLGEMAGAIAIGAPVLKTGKFLVNRLPGAFRLINPESAKFAAVAIGAEGGLFVAGVDEEIGVTGIVGATVLGAGLGGGITKLIQRSAAKRAALLGEDIVGRTATIADDLTPTTMSADDITRAIKSAEIDSNIKLTANIPDDAMAINDEAIAGLRAALSETGETGALGAVKAVQLSEPALSRIRAEYPAYRFEQVGDRLIYGLKPNTRLPKGTTRTAGNLSDSTLKEFERTGFIKGEKLLLDGSQEVEYKFSGKNLNKVFLKGQKGAAVSLDRISRATGEIGGAMENPALLDEYIAFMSGRLPTADIDGSIRAFIAQNADILPAQRIHAIQDLMERVAKRNFDQMGDETQDILRRFRAMVNQFKKTGRAVSVEERAGAKGMGFLDLGDGRIQLIDFADSGNAGPHLLFKNESVARAYIDALEVAAPDMTPAIPGLSSELLRGVAFPTVPLQAGVDAGEQLQKLTIKAFTSNAPGALKNMLYSTAGRWLRGAEAAAQDVERLHNIPIWSEVIQPLSFKLSLAMNFGRAAGRRINDKAALGGLNEVQLDIVERLLRSATKEITETGLPGATPELIARAKVTRQILNDIFDQLSQQSGTTLSAENYFGRYVPDMLRSVGQKGQRDLVSARLNAGQSIPNDLLFWNEMFKEGALGTQQADLATKIHLMIKSGYRKAFAGEEYEAAKRFLDDIDSQEAGRSLMDYLSGVAGGGDAARHQIQQTLGRFYKELGMNVNERDVGNIVDDLVGASYSALMGFRVQLALRNHTQMFNLLAPIVGFARTGRAFRAAGKAENYEWAFSIGAARDQIPVTHAAALSLKGSARKVALRKIETYSLRLYSKADEHNRVTAAVAIRDLMRDFLPKLKSGAISEAEFVSKTKLSFFDDSVQNTFNAILKEGRTLGTVGKTAEERATNFLAREASNLTNFLYGAANSPSWVRTAPGKIFGSYSTFSFGYANYLQVMLRNGTKGERAARLAKHGLVNYALVATGSVVGLDLTRWVAGSSINVIGGTGWIGGPHVDMIDDVRTAVGGAPWERDKARKDFAKSIPKLLVPGAAFARDLWLAKDYLKDGRPQAAIARALGFTIKKDDPTQVPKVIL